jgi:methylated-DNA-[protein]-cysteine S-methyltransferase
MPCDGYTIFKTRWGWFGLLGDDNALRKSILPMVDKQAVLAHLLTDTSANLSTSGFYDDCRSRVEAYFEGENVDFSDLPIALPHLGSFHRHVLKTLHATPYGQTLSYSELAARSGRPLAVRAAASAVAQNPLPLIIPCHRILRKDGSLGGFSAPGGLHTKKRLLNLENPAIFA